MGRRFSFGLRRLDAAFLFAQRFDFVLRPRRKNVPSGRAVTFDLET
jgi:hypothetical protein